MGLTMYIGPSGTGKTQAVYEKIVQTLATCPNEPIILLVPESATYHVERELAEWMPEEGFTTVRVVGFGRLAYQVYQSLGMAEKRRKSLSKVSRNLLLRLIMKREGEQLTLLSQAAKRPTFSQVLQQLFTEFQSFQITSDDLRSGAAQVESETLQKKLQELAHIMDAYQEELVRHGECDEDPLLELVSVLPQSPLMENAHVFVDGMHWFTPVHYQLLYTLFDHAKEAVITIDLPGDEKALQKHNHVGALFSRPHEIYRTLRKRYGHVPCRFFTEPKRFQQDTLRGLSDFFTAPPGWQYEGTAIPVIAGYSREQEADGVCRSIVQAVQERGLRYKDIGIMLRESDTYGDVLEKALARYGIPYFTDRQRPMRTHPVSELLENMFLLLQKPFDHDILFRLLKTDLLPISADEVDELENYCLEFGIRSYHWKKEHWPYRRRTGDDEAENVRLARMNELRQRVQQYVAPWLAWGRTSHTGVEWCTGLFEQLQQWQVPQTLYRWCEDDEARQDLESKSAHQQMYKAVIALIDDIVAVGEAITCTAEEMTLLIQEGMEDVHYSMIPPSLDHVVVTTVERGYSQWWEEVYVMGLNQGVFPQSMGDEGLLKDADRQVLAHIGITLAEGSLPKAFNENFLLYLACTRARQRVTLSYATTGGDSAGLECSLPLKRMERCHLVEPAHMVPLSIETGTEYDYMWRPDQSISLLSTQWPILLQEGSPHSPWFGLYNWARTSSYTDRLRMATAGLGDSNTIPKVDGDIVNELFLRNNYMSGSVTRLEKYEQCPFRFYAQYGLGLQPRLIRQFGSPEIGTFLHENLRRLGLYLLQQNQQWRDLDETQQEKLCQQVAQDIIGEDLYLQETTDAYQQEVEKRLLATLRRTATRLTDWSKHSAFNMVALEQSFGMLDGWHSVNIPLGNERYMRLTGQIDRIDKYTEDGTTYSMVIDYKSGGTKVEAQEIYYGLKLQLMTYLLALEEQEGSIVPAAALYTYVKNPRIASKIPLTQAGAEVVANEDKNLKNQGYFAADINVLHLLDDQVGEHNGTGTEFVPIGFTKAGDIKKSDISKVKTGPDFALLMKYTRKKIHDTGEAIGRGEFPLAPYQLVKRTPCNYCEFKPVCRFDASMNRYKVLPKLSEEAALDKMAETVGVVQKEVDHEVD